MAETAATGGKSKYFDLRQFLSIAAAIAAVVVAFMLYNHFTGKKAAPAKKTITAAAYAALTSDAEKAKWKLNSTTGEYEEA